jgi:signal transduction histidine kinase
MSQTCIGVSTAPAASMQLDLLGRLADAATTRAVAAVIVRVAQAERTCKKATVIWGLNDTQEPESEPISLLDHKDLALARAAARHSLPVFSSDGHQLAIRLFDTNPQSLWAVLLLAIDGPSEGQHFVDETKVQLDLARRHLCRALESADLQTSLKHLKRSESLQRALFAISDLAGSDRDMPGMLRDIHAIVGTLMYAENFFIVLHNAERDSLRFLYYSDAEDSAPRDPLQEISMQSREHSLTWYLLRDGKPLMGSTEQLRTQVSGPLIIIGADSHDWLGVPMLRDGHAHGAVVVQSYQQGIGFSADDQTLLEFVGNQILIALERKQSKQELEQRVRMRTTELADANQVLQLEIAERKRSERLQTALFQIAQLATVDISQIEFYRRVHAVVGELINAKNFYIALLSEDRASLNFEYFVDATEQNQPSRPVGPGVSEYVMRHGKALLRKAEIYNLAREGLIQMETSGKGPVAACWLGVPLVVEQKTIGLIVVQSYDDTVVYGPADQELLSFVASQVANSLHRRRAAESLQSAYALLKQRVQERTQELHARNAELEVAYADLKGAQEQAIQSEKLASIGQLAAGVAHEINNPIGYVKSNLSALQEYVSQLFTTIDIYTVALNRTGDAATLAEVKEACRRIDFDFLTADVPQLLTESREGIERVCKIVHDLKDFSRNDRGASWVRADVHSGLESTLNIVSNQLKYKAQIIKTFGDLPLIECLPSELNQVFLNVLMNAGQAIADRGIITVSTGQTGDKVWIAIGDDGEGIPADVLPRIFDPFFTTKPVGSGTGLGLAISYGIVTKHHGNIEITSVPGEGTLMRIELPIEQPKQT